MNSTPTTAQELPNVHCLVHPWFDAFEHPEYEGYIHAYIEYIARETNDILLIVSDGESFDLEQMRQFALLDAIEAIVHYVSFNDGGICKEIDAFDSSGRYNKSLSHNGLNEDFYRWCMQNVDISELRAINAQWDILREEYFAGKYKWKQDEHDVQASELWEREKQIRREMDIEGLAYKALDEFGKVNDRLSTQRSIKNRGRFFWIHQHAMNALWKERMREIFIRDDEAPDVLPLLPVLQYVSSNGEVIQTPAMEELPEEDYWCEYNASSEEQYWNAAELRDRITYELSMSRNQKLANNQAKDVLADMWVEISSDTRFTFLWEYRDRCVNNVFAVLNYRLSPVTGDNWFIANDVFTLERPENHISWEWY